MLTEGEDDELDDFFTLDDEEEERIDTDEEEEDEGDEELDDEFDLDGLGDLDEEDEDEDMDGDDDILSSFFSFSNELKTMSVFERMRFDGRTVEPISFETLESLVEAQKERRRRERLGSMAQDV